MRALFTRLSKSRYPYQPLIEVTIRRERLLHNLEAFRKIAPGGYIAPVLKSNAYGHGLIEVAEIIEHERMRHALIHDHMPFFVVDSYFEAVALRSRGIRTPLLVIGFTPPEVIMRNRLKHVSFTVGSLEALRAFCGDGYRSVMIHLKVDIGMHRQGILPEELPEAIRMIRDQEMPDVIIEGLCSHFSDSANPHSVHTREQIHTWNTVAKMVRQELPKIRYYHVAATYAHQFTPVLDANLSRLGIGLYGLNEPLENLDEKAVLPILAMNTIVASVKKITNHQSVGYDNTFTAPRDMTIATIPIGYAEGMDRRLSNTGIVLVGPERVPCPIIGLVSMNMTTIDVSSVPHVKMGMKVNVISDNPDDPNSVVNSARRCNASDYEFTVRLPGYLKRVVIDQ